MPFWCWAAAPYGCGRCHGDQPAPHPAPGETSRRAAACRQPPDAARGCASASLSPPRLTRRPSQLAALNLFHSIICCPQESSNFVSPRHFSAPLKMAPGCRSLASSRERRPLVPTPFSQVAHSVFLWREARNRPPAEGNLSNCPLTNMRISGAENGC